MSAYFTLSSTGLFRDLTDNCVFLLGYGFTLV
jgi:hypothetical protein